VVGETSTVKSDFLNAGSFGLFGDALADQLGSGGIAALAREITLA
jgi:hypothetical protein